MKRYYCTYFDRNYLVKALALFKSLSRHEDQDYVVIAVCLDEITRIILENIKPPNVELVPLHLIEKSDPALLAAKQNRSLVEYYWTLTPAVIIYLLEKNPEIARITYLDADLFFYSSPSPMFEEMGDNSILVHEHRFCPSLSSLEHGNGRFNVGLIVFKNDAVGRATLAWWRERCIEWCYLRIEDGKMGDQMYLNEWPDRFGSVHVLQHPGGGVAPWNHEQYAICADAGGSVTIDGFPLIFYHFHALIFAEPDIIIPAQHVHYPLNTDVLRYCYLPYLYALDDAIKAVRNVSQNFEFGLFNQEVPNTKQTYLCKRHRSYAYGDVSATHYRVSLDDSWDCFCTEQYTSSPVYDAPPLLWAPGRPVRSCDDLFLELEGLEIASEINVLYVIGAHLFQERELIFRLFPNIEKIYLFEAIPQLCQMLKEMVASDPRIEVFSYAISDSDERSFFHITDNSGESSSLLKLGKHLDLFPHVHEQVAIPVECRTIESVIRTHHLRQPDMLFIDVQGAEYRILSSLTPELKKQIKLIYTEASHEELYVGARPLADIIELFKDSFYFLGFAPLFNNTPTHGNALFVNHAGAGGIKKAAPPTVLRQEAKEYAISAIVTTYKSEAFMRECLEDLVNQTIFDQVEVVIVDAASPENERAIIEEFQARYPNIKYIRTPERIDIYAAWNVAIKHSTGKYLTTFSTNDRLAKYAYEVLKKALDDNPQKALVYGDTYITKTPHETFERNTHVTVFQWDDYSFEFLLKACSVGPHPMWRKSVFDRVGYFDEQYLAIADQDMWLRIGEQFDMLHLPVFTGLYWNSEDGISNREYIAKPEIYNIHNKYQKRYLERLCRERNINPSSLKVKAAVYCLDPIEHAVPEIRFVRPFTAMDHHLELMWGVSWDKESSNFTINKDILSRADIVIVAGLFPSRETAGFIEELLRSGKPVIYDADDLLCVVEEPGPFYDLIRETQPYIRALMQRADLVTVSTEPLKREYATDAGHIEILPNLLDHTLWPREPNRQSGKKVTIGYAGKGTDEADLNIVEEALRQIAVKYAGQIDFVFLGTASDAIRTLPGFTWINSPSDYSEYVRKMQTVTIDIAIAPLADSRFNRCRSNIKWLEYSACGFAGIYSDLPPYNSSIEQGKTGILVENSTEKWVKAIETLINYPELRKAIAENSRKEVLANYSLAAKGNRYAELYRNLPGIGGAQKYSIIVPVFNQIAFTRQCLDALYATLPVSMRCEIIIVNNGSGDGTAEYLATQTGRITLISNIENLGFTVACNQGARKARGTIVIFLNNDTVPMPGWLESLVAPIDSGEADICGARLLYPDGRCQHAGIAFDERGLGYHIFANLSGDDAPVMERRVMQAVTGACLAMRKSLFEELGGFDEGFRNGFEDVDLCLRAGQKGMRILYVPESEVVHYAEQSDGRKENEVPNMQRFFARWQGKLRQDDKGLYTRFGLTSHREPGGRLIVTPAKSCFPEVSIIIPLYNQVELTRACLETLELNTAGVRYELVLVDNGSSDGTAGLLAQWENKATLVHNVQNLGFAAACNQGSKAAKSKYLLFLNNDTEPLAGWLGPLLDVFRDNENVGIVGNQLLYPDGTIQHGGVAIVRDDMRNISISPCHMDYRMDKTAGSNLLQQISAVTGACMMVSKPVFEEVGGFDESYWNGFEDVDLCFKVRKAGYAIYYQPASVVIHHESKSGNERRVRENENLRLLQERWENRITPDLFRQRDGKVVRYDFASIIILTYNSANTILRCLDSVRNSLRPYDEVIIVDNGSKDQTVAIVERFITGIQQFRLIENGRNLGFSAGTNVGISNSVNPYVVLLNPDTIVSTGWLDNLYAHFYSSGHTTGAVGPISNYVAGLQKMEIYQQEQFPAQATIENVAKSFSLWNKGKKKVESKLLIGFCMMIRRTVLNDLGMLDENLFLGNDDLELSWRLRANGYHLFVATDTFVYHEGQQSFNTEPSETTKRLVQESTDALYDKLVRHYGAGNVPTPGELWDMEWFAPSNPQFNRTSRLKELEIVPGKNVEAASFKSGAASMCVPADLPSAIQPIAGEAGNVRYPLIPLVGHSSSSILQKLTSSQRLKGVLHRYTTED